MILQPEHDMPEREQSHAASPVGVARAHRLRPWLVLFMLASGCTYQEQVAGMIATGTLLGGAMALTPAVVLTKYRELGHPIPPCELWLSFGGEGTHGSPEELDPGFAVRFDGISPRYSVEERATNGFDGVVTTYTTAPLEDDGDTRRTRFTLEVLRQWDRIGPTLQQGFAWYAGETQGWGVGYTAGVGFAVRLRSLQFLLSGNAYLFAGGDGHGEAVTSAELGAQASLGFRF